MGVIPQALTSDPELTAQENMLIHAKLYGVPRATRDKLIQRSAGIRGSGEVQAMRWCAHFPAACAGAWKSRAGWCTRRRFCFWTSRLRGSIRCRASNVWEMIRNLREQSDLTILLTTHYMDEADKLCDRIAIVDHGKLAALDTPTRLKDSVPGNDSRGGGVRRRAGGLERSAAQAGCRPRDVSQRDGMVHITSHDGPATVAALMDLARARSVTGEKSDRAEHHAGRRVSALHRQRFAGRGERRSAA